MDEWADHPDYEPDYHPGALPAPFNPRWHGGIGRFVESDDEDLGEHLRSLENTHHLYSARGTRLLQAPFVGHVADVAYLLEEHFNVNQTDSDGRTALHAAALRNDLGDVGRHLLFGAKLNVRDNAGDTAADIAARCGHNDIANAIHVEEKSRRRMERRMVMLVASKVTVTEGEKQPLLAHLHSKCPDAVIHVGSFL